MTEAILVLPCSLGKVRSKPAVPIWRLQSEDSACLGEPLRSAAGCTQSLDGIRGGNASVAYKKDILD